jgi:hypothetical protein
VFELRWTASWCCAQTDRIGSQQYRNSRERLRLVLLGVTRIPRALVGSASNSCPIISIEHRLNLTDVNRAKQRRALQSAPALARPPPNRSLVARQDAWPTHGPSCQARPLRWAEAAPEARGVTRRFNPQGQPLGGPVKVWLPDVGGSREVTSRATQPASRDGRINQQRCRASTTQCRRQAPLSGCATRGPSAANAGVGVPTARLAD